MKPIVLAVLLSFVLTFSISSIVADTQKKESSSKTQWIDFPDDRLQVNGLPWFNENKPELWRLPASSRGKVPAGVWSRAVAPDGGRIRFYSDSTRLVIRVVSSSSVTKPCHFDAYIDDQYVGSARLTDKSGAELVLFESKESRQKQITIYLPNNHEVRVQAIGIDSGSKLANPKSFAGKLPIVCYGSSVLQGTGSAHPSKTYPAGVARRLDLDFVNLGFGGAGKAEADVVQLVNQLDACCYIFDLGKSYGNQSGTAYVEMLNTIRSSHPTTPIVCVTPIYSTKEATEPDYVKKSEDLRKLMRDAASERQKSGDTNIFVVEGLALFGPNDKTYFNDPLHPNDEGNDRIAERLTPTIKRTLFREKVN